MPGRPNSPAFHSYPGNKPMFGLKLDSDGENFVHSLAFPNGPEWKLNESVDTFVDTALQIIEERTGVLCDWVIVSLEPRHPMASTVKTFTLLAFDGVDENNPRTTQDERRKLLELFGKSEADLTIGYSVYSQRWE
ncbi:hypothetical protein Hypma_003221 [Hypsizygus marmoreus]|uniref:Uncharacterized protein n=1 Tax=Hypsizygus marmoreus TaxID=39966 RepID=A0A369K1C7_HYPMA|nr:hypothetical protein Hypma_003221 [Hypsizygus marmoreus]